VKREKERDKRKYLTVVCAAPREMERILEVCKERLNIPCKLKTLNLF
jgi:hypothetical protein